MVKKVKANLVKCLREEKGQALVAVLALLVIGSLTLPPLLSFLGTTLKAGQLYQEKTNELYAADSGVEDAIWQIKFDRLGNTLHDPDYDTYDYSTNWSYVVDDLINGLTANVTIHNVWIPSNVGPPDPADARDIIEREVSEYADTNTTNKIIVAGTATDADDYRIKIDFYPAVGDEEAVSVSSVGIWLPLGFSYVEDSSNLEADIADPYYAVADITDYAGGEAIVWEFASVPFTDFPTEIETTDYPQSAEITFKYTADVTDARPVAIAWMTSSGVADTPVSWDVDTKIYKIISAAGDTEIEAYGSRCELRDLGAAITGDYQAVGNSLMIYDAGGNDGKRDILLGESDATVANIPNGDDPADNYDVGEVMAAYLYWSGSFREPFTTAISPWPDTCSNFNNWTNSSPNTVWQIDWNEFEGRYTGSDPSARYLEMADVFDLSGYAEGEVVVEWDQDDTWGMEPTDGLTFELSSDNGSSWSDPITAFYDNFPASGNQYFYYIVPEEYLTVDFKLRFHLEDCGNEDVNIDNFAIAEIIGTADTTAVFKIDGTQVYLDGGGEPQQGIQDIVADRSSVLGYNIRGEYPYACHLDVTDLLREYGEVVENEYGDDVPTGNAEYNLGDVDADTGAYRSYAGWSLIIIYSSPKTAGHQLYLYDDIALNNAHGNLDFDFDGQPGGDITGFVVPEPIEGEEVAARLTAFVGEGDDNYAGDSMIFNYKELSDGDGALDDVWDSESIGMSEDGVDIDTFTIYWDDENIYGEKVLQADDTEAHIDLPSGTDVWMLVYMILSVRSETVTGGTTHYVIYNS